MDIEVIEHKDNILRFVVHESSIAIMNTYRRLIISEVPTLAIEDIILVENSSPMLDEIIAHRLGLIPITTPIDEFVVTSECENCDGEGCQFCSATLTLDIENEGNKPKMVYSKDLQSTDDKIIPVSEKIPIAKLAPGQKIVLEAIAFMGRGEEHAKWSPVANCSYRYYPEVKQDKSKCTGCKECVEACPKDLLEVKRKEVTLTDPLECTLCDLCTNACAYDSLEMVHKEGDFIFTLESTGAVKPLDIFRKATEILKNKTKDFQDEYKKALELFAKEKK